MQLWIDTQAGNIVVGNYDDEAHPERHCPEEWNDAAADVRYHGMFDEHGREGAAWCRRVDTFLAACERNLRALRWMPGLELGWRGSIDEDEADGRFALGLGEHRRIMRNHGWPGDGWDPKAARKEVGRLLGCSGEG